MPSSTAVDIAAACLSVVGVAPLRPALDEGIGLAAELWARFAAECASGPSAEPV